MKNRRYRSTLLLPWFLVMGGTTLAQEIQGVTMDDTWRVGANGRSADVEEDGTFRIENVSPNSIPLIANQVLLLSPCLYMNGSGFHEGERVWVQSENIFIDDGETSVVDDLTFTAQPPISVVRGALSVSPRQVRLGETADVTLLLELSDGSTVDATLDPCTAIITSFVSRFGSVQGGRYVAPLSWPVGQNPFAPIPVSLSALHENWSFRTALSLLPPDDPPPTTITGTCLTLPNFAPASGAEVRIDALGLATLADADGNFEFTDLESRNGPYLLRASLGSLVVTKQVEGFVEADAGILLLDRPVVEGAEIPLVNLGESGSFGASWTLGVRAMGGTAGTAQLTGPSISAALLNLNLYTRDPTLVDFYQGQNSAPSGAEIDTARFIRERIEPKMLTLSSEDVRFCANVKSGGIFADDYTALPRECLGTDYVVLVGATNQLHPQGIENYYLVVAAPEDDTTVTITPSRDAGARLAGEPFDVELTANDVFVLGFDISGGPPVVQVEATRDIAAYSYQRGQMWNCFQFGGFDISIIQHVPVRSWGTEFRVLDVEEHDAPDVVGIAAVFEDTMVQVDQGGVVTQIELDAAEITEILVDVSARISASRPVEVQQHPQAGCISGLQSTTFGMLVPPVESYTQLHRLSVEGDNRYLNIVAPTATAAAGQVFVNAVAVDPALFTTLEGGDFAGATVQISPGWVEVFAPDPIMVWYYNVGERLKSVGSQGAMALPK